MGLVNLAHVMPCLEAINTGDLCRLATFSTNSQRFKVRGATVSLPQYRSVGGKSKVRVFPGPSRN